MSALERSYILSSQLQPSSEILIANSATRIGCLYSDLKHPHEIAKAIPYFHEAIRIFEKQLGKNSEYCVQVRLHLISCLQQGHLESEAKPIMEVVEKAFQSHRWQWEKREDITCNYIRVLFRKFGYQHLETNHQVLRLVLEQLQYDRPIKASNMFMEKANYLVNVSTYSVLEPEVCRALAEKALALLRTKIAYELGESVKIDCALDAFPFIEQLRPRLEVGNLMCIAVVLYCLRGEIRDRDRMLSKVREWGSVPQNTSSKILNPVSMVADCLYRHGQYEMALSLTDQMTDLGWVRGLCCFNLKDYDRAASLLENYLRGISFEPDGSVCWLKHVASVE